MAVMDVVHLMRDAALDAVARGELALPPALATAPGTRDALAGRSGGGGAQVRLDSVPPAETWKRPVPEARRALYAPSPDPRESAEAYRRVLRDEVGDPSLALFTPASRVMRARSPMAPFEERTRLAALERAGALRLAVQGDYAVLRGARPIRGLVPILLHREEGLWRVDLVETFKNCFFASDGTYVLWNGSAPYAFAFEGARPPRHDDLSPIPLGAESLEDALARLASDDTAEGRFQLAELTYRNVWLVPEALPLYEAAARRAPGDWRIVSTLADRASYVGMPDLAIPYVERLGTRGYRRLAALHEQAGRRDVAARYRERAAATAGTSGAPPASAADTRR
jgi:hypothetical protein